MLLIGIVHVSNNGSPCIKFSLSGLHNCHAGTTASGKHDASLRVTVQAGAWVGERRLMSLKELTVLVALLTFVPLLASALCRAGHGERGPPRRDENRRPSVTWVRGPISAAVRPARMTDNAAGVVAAAPRAWP